ncbi:MAG: nickel transport protein [Thermodesulfobacterium sp.]|nr:nickel transport protein [Thermodesulfobacterium sp.]
MLKILKNVILSTSIVMLSATFSYAHFVVLKPDTENVVDKKKPVRVEALFTHPMEGGPHMDFKIKKSELFEEGKRYPVEWKVEYIPSSKGSNKKVPKYVTNLSLNKPGLYQLYVDPEPYFEPAEGKYIQQITKVVFSAFGKEGGWDEPIGLKVEIIPLVKPFALWEGNLFKGRVLVDGKPAANVEVEVEYLNTQGFKAPYDSLITQVVKTDENGYFEYTLPWEGWWGFSAITEGGKIKGNDGKEYPLELDAVIWVKAYPKPKKGGK